LTRPCFSTASEFGAPPSPFPAIRNPPFTFFTPIFHLQLGQPCPILHEDFSVTASSSGPVARTALLAWLPCVEKRRLSSNCCRRPLRASSFPVSGTASPPRAPRKRDVSHRSPPRPLRAALPRPGTPCCPVYHALLIFFPLMSRGQGPAPSPAIPLPTRGVLVLLARLDPSTLFSATEKNGTQW